MRSIYLFLIFLLVLLCVSCGSSSRSPEPIPDIVISKEVTVLPSGTPQPTAIPTATRPPLPTSTRIPPITPTSIPDIIYELPEAIREGVVSATILGRNLQEMKIELEVNVDFSFGLYILPGTLFRTESAGVQTMVAIEFRDFVLSPGAELEISLEVACAEMEKATPSSANSFVPVSPLEIGAEFDGRGEYLTRLVSSDIFQEDFPFRGKQFAIWTITDNPARYDFVHLGTYGAGSGPSDDEIAFFEFMFDYLEIPSSEFALFQ